MRRRVLITGLGVVSAVGVGADAFWRGITTGATGFSPAPPEIERLGAKVVATVKDFSGSAYLKNERNGRILIARSSCSWAPARSRQPTRR